MRPRATGATLTKSMRTLDNVPKSIVTNAMPVISTYETDERTIDQGTRTISNVLLSSPESYTCAFGSDEVESTGSQPLLTFTTELRYIDNEAHRNFVLAAARPSSSRKSTSAEIHTEMLSCSIRQ